jgi:peroxiredoxin
MTGRKGLLQGGRGLCAALSLILAVGAALPCFAEGMAADKFKPGDKAPDFTLKNLANADVKLSSYAGKNVVLLNFWGLRCGACLEEMPYLEKIGKSYQDKGLVVLGVDTDGVPAEDVVATLQEVQVAVSYPLLVDPDFSVTDAYTNFLVPLTIVIDKAGTIQYIHTGFDKGREKEYEQAVLKAIGS